MHKPQMIIFDFGHTLVRELSFDGVRGTRALMEYAVCNEDDLTAEQISAFSDELFFGIAGQAREHGAEVHNHCFQRVLYESLGIRLELTPYEMERIFWDNAAPAQPMPHIGETLDRLEEMGIRTGVISNISFSGDTLRERINRLIPGNRFEFIIASSEYMVRKPHPLIFRVALRKAGLSGGAVWYCGDSVRFDVKGAVAAGIFPVWYRSPLPCFYRDTQEPKPAYDHLEITDWTQLIQALEELE